MTTTKEIIAELEALRGSEEKRRVLSSFFKTGKGQYGEGDIMLGVTVPNTRSVAQKYAVSSGNLLGELLQSPVHEVRLCALLMLVENFKRACRLKDCEQAEAKKAGMVALYLQNAPRINNWDLVDLSAPKILGEYLKRRADRSVLYELVKDKLLWRRRIAIVSTLTLIRDGQFDDALRLAEMLLADTEDLMHKATGWMLREVGKKDEAVLRGFLDKHLPAMPRTALRYAIERLAPEVRELYMKK